MISCPFFICCVHKSLSPDFTHGEPPKAEAPRMSGSKMDDHISSVELNRSALRWALKFLRSNGCFAAGTSTTHVVMYRFILLNTPCVFIPNIRNECVLTMKKLVNYDWLAHIACNTITSSTRFKGAKENIRS